jgi:hypothetical protein
MRTKILISLFALAIAGLIGCQTVEWKAGGTPHTAKDGDFTVTVPEGWTFAERLPGNIVGTRDGLLLQRLMVERRELKDPLPVSKRVLAASLTPLELAEAITDDLRANRSLLGIEVTESQPATVGGQSGFKLLINFHTADKLRGSEAIFGCIKGDRLYLLVFIAPARHYFTHDLAAFEEAAKTFQFGKS